jgi:phospholipid/cholesterol/gamma-HCH transport system permease protein
MMEQVRAEEMNDPRAEIGEIAFRESDDDTLEVALSGTWKIGLDLPSADEVRKALESFAVRRMAFETRDLADWDSALLTFLLKVRDYAAQEQIQILDEGLPQGARRLIALALAVPERKGARKEAKRDPFLVRIGEEGLRFFRSTGEMVGFIGEAYSAFLKLLRGRARFRSSDLVLFIQECGAEALPIVSLISLLVGMILAFVAAIQLKLFGAQIFVADIVGIAMVRVMGAIMTGIIVGGRTGAAFAAQLGTMQVNEEIDALQTLGVSPMEFLVLPRMLALALMMPLLCLYSDLMGILGGMIVGVFMLDLSFAQYFHETALNMQLTYFWVGLFHSFVFGILIALAGCLRGMQCGRSASEVGKAATSAVVTSIVSIVLATAIITFVCQVLGI